MAEQIEHLPLLKFEKAELNIASLVALLVFFVQKGEAYDQEDARVGLQTY